MKNITFILTVLLFLGCSTLIKAQSFVHPGMLHSKEDLDRIKKNVKDSIEPWKSAWNVFKQSKWLSNNYHPRPLDTVGRGVGSKGQDNIQNDCAAAYYNSIAWYVSGDKAYAKRTIDILNGWSYKVKQINGKDAVLCAGIYGYKFANAAEIIRYTYQDWPQKDVEQFKSMLINVFYPVIKDFSPFANGNWDAACLPTMMSIGIFCDDRVMFDRAVKYYMDGWGDGTLMNYIVNETGQVQESGRDQPHTQGGIGHLANAAEIGYHQGLDMYGAFSNRLLKGFEYTAKYNLGNEVPFVPNYDRTGKYNQTIISDQSRGKWSPVYEMVYNHYQNRMGIAAPYTAKVAASYRPEPFSIDHPGAGTLLFTLPSYKPLGENYFPSPAMPGGLIAKAFDRSIILQWVPALNVTGYTISRAVRKGGPYTIIAKNIKETTFKDSNITAGNLYYYVVASLSTSHISPNSLETSICAGLPNQWKYCDIGVVNLPGTSTFDGITYTIEGAGTDIGGNNDQFQFAYVTITGNGSITSRFVPQVASQFAKMGVMIRDALTPDATNASLLLMPAETKDKELPDWSAGFSIRNSIGSEATIVNSDKLGEPAVKWGRLMEPYWLRLNRKDNIITASISPDGKKWKDVGEAKIQMSNKMIFGLAVCSRLSKVTTTVMFDNVEVLQTGK